MVASIVIFSVGHRYRLSGAVEKVLILVELLFMGRSDRKSHYKEEPKGRLDQKDVERELVVEVALSAVEIVR